MLTLLYEALTSPLGIVISTPEPERTRMQLYAERKARADPALDCISICLPPFSTSELWLVKTQAKQC